MISQDGVFPVPDWRGNILSNIFTYIYQAYQSAVWLFFVFGLKKKWLYFCWCQCPWWCTVVSDNVFLWLFDIMSKCYFKYEHLETIPWEHTFFLLKFWCSTPKSTEDIFLWSSYKIFFSGLVVKQQNM